MENLFPSIGLRNVEGRKWEKFFWVERNQGGLRGFQSLTLIYKPYTLNRRGYKVGFRV